MREFRDEHGKSWEALAVDEIVAHGKKGARLAFRPTDEPAAAPVLSTITFNSRAAADFALGSLGMKELRRRLSLALEEAGTV
ncbi:MAG TPA: hypothetical protein VFL93_11675 [Longimicrobiaceae bacterium]|nr:hypothetical protein [Longimicrobiaceae bacterium]